MRPPSPSLRFVLALLLLGGALPAAELLSPPDPGGVAAPELCASRRGSPPRAFLPLEDGSVLLLDGEQVRLTRLRGEQVLSEAPLRGADFDPGECDLVDLALDGQGRVLVLDALTGSVWVAGLDGRIEGRFGLFVAPMRLARGADGAVYVQDPGNASVTSFRGGQVRASYPSRLAMAPHGTAAGEVPFVRHGRSQRRTQVGLLASLGGGKLEARALGVVEPREGQRILDTRILGSHGDHLLVEVASYPGGDAGEPTAVDVWVLATGAGGTSAAPRRVPVPVLRNHCWDCGPDFRVGPDGALWFYRLDQDVYRVHRMPRPEVRP